MKSYLHIAPLALHFKLFATNFKSVCDQWIAKYLVRGMAHNYIYSQLALNWTVWTHAHANNLVKVAGLHYLEMSGDRRKRSCKCAWTRDPRSSAEFHPWKLSILVMNPLPQSHLKRLRQRVICNIILTYYVLMMSNDEICNVIIT